MSTTTTNLTQTAPVLVLDGSRMILRFVQRLVGVAMLLVAVGLWLMPGSAFDSDLMLFKLLLSVVSAFAGFGLIQSASGAVAPTAEIDTIRREVRLVRGAAQDKGNPIARCAFDDLSKVEVEGPHVRLWDAKGGFLTEATLHDPQEMGHLQACLRDAGKIG